jgi:hypothetical protein
MENTPSERWQAAKRLQYSLSVTVPAFAANLPHGRREIGSRIVDRQNNASLNQRFERLQLALKRLARSNRRAITRKRSNTVIALMVKRPPLHGEHWKATTRPLLVNAKGIQPFGSVSVRPVTPDVSMI